MQYLCHMVFTVLVQNSCFDTSFARLTNVLFVRVLSTKREKLVKSRVLFAKVYGEFPATDSARHVYFIPV